MVVVNELCRQINDKKIMLNAATLHTKGMK